MIFALQPFFPWTKKKVSEQEALVFRELEEMQSFSDFLMVKEAIGRHPIYTEYVDILENLSSEYGVEFYDLNPDFGGQETLFCDQVHLTDCGNLLAARLIHNRLNKF